MDLLTGLAINVILQLLSDKRAYKKAIPALAKVYVTLWSMSLGDEQLAAAIEEKRLKWSSIPATQVKP